MRARSARGRVSWAVADGHGSAGGGTGPRIAGPSANCAHARPPPSCPETLGLASCVALATFPPPQHSGMHASTPPSSPEALGSRACQCPLATSPLALRSGPYMGRTCGLTRHDCAPLRVSSCASEHRARIGRVALSHGAQEHRG